MRYTLAVLALTVCALIAAFSLSSHYHPEAPDPPTLEARGATASTVRHTRLVVPAVHRAPVVVSSLEPAPRIEILHTYTDPIREYLATVEAATAERIELLPTLYYDWDEDPACKANPDRYEWRKYAIAVGFPEYALDELAFVIKHESGGDLCAVNNSSGATCWIQQVPGSAAFLDPMTCMSIGLAKWHDGGDDFYRHWYQWWPGSIRP